jgi:hypothetical protein
MTPRVDRITGAAIGIAYEHHEVHEGGAFSAFFQNALAAIGEQTVIAFITPATGPLIHIVADAWANDSVDLIISEAPTIIGAGAAGNPVPLNRNRQIATASQVTRTENPQTVGEVSTYNEAQAGASFTTGTTLWQETFGGANHPLAQAGGQTRGGREFVLAPATAYGFEIFANTNNATNTNLILTWYEHTSKDFVN